MNLMNRFSQAHGYKASDYISELSRYCGRPVDLAVVNSSRIPKEVVAAYIKEKASVIEDDLQETKKFKVVRADLVKQSKIERQDGDSLQRSFFRHDGDKLARVLIKILL